MGSPTGSRFYLVPKCRCGYYAEADCTQCNQPLCKDHAYNPYSQKLNEIISELIDPSILGFRIWVSLAANEKVLAGYGDRHVCRKCHIANTRDEHILQSLPQLGVMTLFEFALFMLFSEYRFSLTSPVPTSVPPDSSFRGLDAMHITESLNLTSQHIVQGSLRIAEQEQVAPETTVFKENQTKRKQSSYEEMSGWHFITECTDYFEEGTQTFMRIFITPDGNDYQLSHPMKGEDYAPCRVRDVPYLFASVLDPQFGSIFI